MYTQEIWTASCFNYSTHIPDIFAFCYFLLFLVTKEDCAYVKLSWAKEGLQHSS